MNAQEIITKIKEAGAATMEEVRDVLEDGAALAALGITDEHQEAVEEAHEMTFVPKSGGFIGYSIGLNCIDRRGKLVLAKIEFSRLPGGRVKLQAVSGRNLASLPHRVTISAEEYENAPHDPCNDAERAIWALKRVGLQVAH